jgi:murein DD-endopeptidase MepM/ murein hydrolase activator NlpD
VKSLRCIERCAGLREAAVGGLVRLRGDDLSPVDEVAFPAEAGEVSAAPERVEPQLVEVRVPAGAVSGRPRVEAADGATDISPRRLEVVKPRRLPRGFELRDTSVRPGPYVCPVRGSHGYGGFLQEFGAPRVGGRRHQGQDVYAACGTRLEAARGGTVQASAFHRPLYGHYVVIDVRGSSADHLYAHLREPSPLRAGDHVHTRQRIGEVGRTGNARTTPCHLHFEIWPRGRHNGSPVDPEPALRRWDGWS